MSRKEKPAKVRMFKITNWTWRYCLFVRIGGTREEAERFFDRKFGEKPGKKSSVSACGHATTFFIEHESDHLIWFESKPGGGMAAHEAFHSVYHVMRVKGMPTLSYDNEEAWAYLLQWTMTEIGARIW